MNKLLKNKKLRASSLTEVLVVIGIVSTTMVMAVSLMVNSLYKIKLNEIEDTANNLMIQALEISKSPTDVTVSDSLINQSVNNEFYFSLNTEGNNNFLEIQTENLLLDCTRNSPYFIDTTDEQGLICLQLIVTPRNGGYFDIVSKVGYRVREETVINFIKGRRYGEFEILQ